jgi:hypothetical protein
MQYSIIAARSMLVRYILGNMYALQQLWVHGTILDQASTM